MPRCNLVILDVQRFSLTTDASIQQRNLFSQGDDKKQKTLVTLRFSIDFHILKSNFYLKKENDANNLRNITYRQSSFTQMFDSQRGTEGIPLCGKWGGRWSFRIFVILSPLRMSGFYFVLTVSPLNQM